MVSTDAKEGVARTVQGFDKIGFLGTVSPLLPSSKAPFLTGIHD